MMSIQTCFDSEFKKHKIFISVSLRQNSDYKSSFVSDGKMINAGDLVGAAGLATQDANFL